MALNLDKPAFTTFLHTMFSTLQHLELTTISISGTKEFTAWEWEIRFVKKEGKSEFEDWDKGVEEGRKERVGG